MTKRSRSSALPIAEPPPTGGQTGATTEPTARPFDRDLVGEPFDIVVGGVDAGVRVGEEEVDAVELDAVDLRRRGQIEHVVEADRRFRVAALCRRGPATSRCAASANCCAPPRSFAPLDDEFAAPALSAVARARRCRFSRDSSLLKYRLHASMLGVSNGSRAPAREYSWGSEKEETIMTSIDVDKVATHSFDWGVIKWLVSPDQNPGANITFGEVVLLPGQGHVRHNHPTSEEILYVLSGVGEQMVDDAPPFVVRAGDTIYIPTAIYHSTVNKGWEPLRLLALYNPGGAERALIDLPDYRSTPAGQVLCS